MHSLRCLAGSDVNRFSGEILVSVNDEGSLIHESYYDGELLRIGQTTLMGWGDLDGFAVEVTKEGVAWTVTIPISEFERIGFDPENLKKADADE